MEKQIPRPVADAIIEKGNTIVIIKRGIEPFKGQLGLPGGHMDYGETIEQAAIREAEEETGLKIKLKAILGAYSDLNRDPRYHTISVVFIADPVGGKIAGDDDAADAFWIDLDKLNLDKMIFDHGKIVSDYIKWKKQKRTYWSTGVSHE